MKRYQYFIVSDSFGIKEINHLLSDGWMPVRETPMGAAGTGERPNHIRAFSLILLEKDVDPSAPPLAIEDDE